MSASIKWEGFFELQQELRNLPEHLAQHAESIVQQAATQAHAEIHAKYSEHRHSGTLANRLRVEKISTSRFGAAWRVRSMSPLAWIFENGTQARHTALGWNRGAMWKGRHSRPPGKVFVPAVMRHRRSMYRRLVDLLKSTGATVTGEP